jgi:general stress protein 26
MNTEAYAKLMNYIDHNPMAVLGTVNDDGTPHGAIVYVCNLSNRTIFFVTKNGTQKYNNLAQRPVVSLTIGNDKDSSTLQATGKAFIIDDAEQLDIAMKKMSEVHAIMTEWLPPLAKLRAGNYAVIGIELLHARLGEFMGLGIGSREIFTEI